MRVLAKREFEEGHLLFQIGNTNEVLFSFHPK